MNAPEIDTSLSLFPYQKEGVARLQQVFGPEGRRAALLADVPGLGKTPQAVMLAKKMGWKNVLVLTPATLRFVWVREAARWIGEHVHTPETSDPTVNMDGWNAVSYSVIWNDKHRQFRQRKWDAVICDESHYLKSYEGEDERETNAKVAHSFFTEIAPRSGKILFVTGTPIPSYPVEIWPMAHLMLPDVPRIRDREIFSRYFCKGFKGKFGKVEKGGANLRELRRALQPVMVRRHKKDVLKDLPPKSINLVELPPSKEIKVALDMQKGEITATMESVAKIRERMAEAKETNSLAALEKAQSELKEWKKVSHDQLARMRNTLSKPKAVMVAEYVKLLLDGGVNKVVVGFWHKDHGDELESYLHRYGTVRIDGSVPATKRGGIVDKFQTCNETRVFLGQIRAAGTGITLTAASHVVIGEPDWVPANISQFGDRCHRVGQLDNVTIHMIAAEGTPDATVMKALVKKVGLIREAIDGGPTKQKRTRSFIGEGVDREALGRSLSYDERRWVHRTLFRLTRASSGTIGDGKGLSGSTERQGRRLSGLQRPSDGDYGAMAVLIAHHRRQAKEMGSSETEAIIAKVLDHRKQ